MTFFIVLMAWVFFRTADLPAALSYLGSLFGLATVQDGAGLLGGIIYQPYYWATFSFGGGDYLGMPANVGLDADDSAVEDGADCFDSTDFPGSSDDADLQPLHLLHFLNGHR